MTTYDAVLAAANQLPPPDRLRLIDALWDTVPSDAEAPFSDEWVVEIERRMDDLETGRDTTVPWTQVRDEALARLRHGKEH
jgi:putative addiction module component (TIGR02574 family)